MCVKYESFDIKIVEKDSYETILEANSKHENGTPMIRRVVRDFKISSGKKKVSQSFSQIKHLEIDGENK